MHILFMGGCWNLDVRFFRCIRASLKLRFSHVAEYMEGWKLPACLHNTVNVKNIFSDTREDAMDRGNGVRASASELLTCYALVRRFIEEHIVGRDDGVMDIDCAIILALCDLIDCIQATKRGLVSSVEAGAMVGIICTVP